MIAIPQYITWYLHYNYLHISVTGPSKLLNIKTVKGTQRHAQNMIYGAVVCVNAAQESCITKYNNMLPTHFLPEGEVFYTLIFASCQIQSPSACYIIKDGSDTYHINIVTAHTRMQWRAITESYKCSKQASVFQTCAQYLANLSNLSHLYLWNMSSLVYNSHPFCLNNNSVKDTCKQMSGLQSKH